MADIQATPTLLIDATYRLHPADVDAYKALAARMAEAANKRDGCAFLKVAQNIVDPTTFHLIEGWESQEAFEAHVASDEFQDVLKNAVKLRIADRFADMYVVAETRKLEMPS